MTLPVPLFSFFRYINQTDSVGIIAEDLIHGHTEGSLSLRAPHTRPPAIGVRHSLPSVYTPTSAFRC